MTDKTELQRVRNILDGTEGLIYIMFCGRETYVSQIQGPLLKAHVFRNKENVSQAFYRLLEKEVIKGDYLKFVKELNAPGQPKVYTANLDPIFKTLQLLKIEFDETEFRSIIEQLSSLNDTFAECYTSLIKESDGTIRYNRITWYSLLSAYFLFLSYQIISVRAYKLGGEAVFEKESQIFKTKFENVLNDLIIDELFNFLLSFRKHIPIGTIDIQDVSPDTTKVFVKASFALLLEDTGYSFGRKFMFKMLDKTWDTLMQNFKSKLLHND